MVEEKIFKITNEKEYWERHKHYHKKLKKLIPIIVKDVNKFFEESNNILDDAIKEQVFPPEFKEQYFEKVNSAFVKTAEFKNWSNEKRTKFMNALKEKILRLKKKK